MDARYNKREDFEGKQFNLTKDGHYKFVNKSDIPNRYTSCSNRFYFIQLPPFEFNPIETK